MGSCLGTGEGGKDNESDKCVELGRSHPLLSLPAEITVTARRRQISQVDVNMHKIGSGFVRKIREVRQVAGWG